MNLSQVSDLCIKRYKIKIFPPAKFWQFLVCVYLSIGNKVQIQVQRCENSISGSKKRKNSVRIRNSTDDFRIQIIGTYLVASDHQTILITKKHMHNHKKCFVYLQVQ